MAQGDIACTEVIVLLTDLCDVCTYRIAIFYSHEYRHLAFSLKPQGIIRVKCYSGYYGGGLRLP